ncbi:general amino acid permease 1 [Amylocystis lapponica]|nr:general amino acid permease 1 [Amylocystis lapponica]
MSEAQPTTYDEKVDNSSSVEKGGVHDYARRLKQRHVQMIAIAGTLGTGLFLGSGNALREGGPLGALIAYALVGTTGYATLCSVGEMTSFAPISGSFPHFAARWVDPAFGFALELLLSGAISTPVEITAAGILITFWDQNIKHQPAYLAAITVCVCAINIFGVRWFGESEFVFSIIKIMLIVGLILAGLIIDLGGGPDHDRIGFRYWKNPGAVAPAGLVPNHIGVDRFIGILTVIVQAAFSFQGMELVAIAASETESPRRNIAKAVRRVFWRIVIFYILGILITGMLVPYNDDDLLSTSGTAAESPYVIAMTRSGVKVLPHIINAAIFTSAFSAGNSFLFSSSRILYGLAVRGQAPKFLTYCTKSGLPLAAVLTSSAFTWLSFMTVSSGAETVFTWLQNIVTVGGFFGWLAIDITYLRFYKGYTSQGFDRSKLTYSNRLQPWLAWWGVFWITIFILINGLTVFWNFNASGFLTAYINIPIFFGLFGFWKVFKRTHFWTARQMDFVTGIPTMEETEVPEVPPVTIAQKIAAILF